MEMPQCCCFPVVLKQFLKQFPTLWLPGEFSVFVLWGTSLDTQGLVLPSTGAPHLVTRAVPHLGETQGNLLPLPPALTDVLDKGPELSLSWNPSDCLKKGIFGAFSHHS